MSRSGGGRRKGGARSGRCCSSWIAVERSGHLQGDRDQRRGCSPEQGGVRAPREHREWALLGRSSQGHRRRLLCAQIAWSPSRNLFMYALMIWLTGSELNVYTIFILQPLLSGPLTQLMGMKQRESAPRRCRAALATFECRVCPRGGRGAEPRAVSRHLRLLRAPGVCNGRVQDVQIRIASSDVCGLGQSDPLSRLWLASLGVPASRLSEPKKQRIDPTSQEPGAASSVSRLAHSGPASLKLGLTHPARMVRGVTDIPLVSGELFRGR